MSEGAATTLLFLTGGPYFWPHQAIWRAKYEVLSRDFQGFVLSFVSRKEWRRVPIGRFELVGCYVSARIYRVLPFRLLIRLVFTVTAGLYLHLFRRRVDAVIAYDPFVTGLFGYILSRLIGAKLIVEVNNDLADRTNWNVDAWTALTRLKAIYVSRASRFVLKRAEAVRLMYPGQLDGFLDPEFGRPEWLRKVQYGFDFVPVGLFRRGQEAGRTILFVGHPWYRKGVDILIRAFNEVAKQCLGWRLKIVGYLPERLDHADLLEGNDQIEFVGPVMPDAMTRLMEECAFFVLPSRSEGMPRVLIEAMASGKAVIASRVSGIPHYVRHGETGLLFDSEDVGEFARLMLLLAADPRRRSELGSKGYEYAHTHLSEECFVEQIHRLVELAEANRKLAPRPGRGTGPA